MATKCREYIEAASDDKSCPPFRRRGNPCGKIVWSKQSQKMPAAFLPTFITLFILIILVIIIKSSSTNTSTPTHSMWQKAEQVQLVVLLSYSGWLCYWLCLYAFLCVVVCSVGRLRVSRCPQSRSWRDSFWAPLLHPAYNDYIMYIIYYIIYIWYYIMII